MTTEQAPRGVSTPHIQNNVAGKQSSQFFCPALLNSAALAAITSTHIQRQSLCLFIFSKIIDLALVEI